MIKLYKKYEEVLKYLIFGFLTMVVSIGTYLLFANTFLASKTDLDIQIANVLSWICAVTFAYLTNKKYVFKSKVKGKKAIKECYNFFMARITSLIIEMILMYILYSIMNIDDTISKIIVQIVVVILNYIFSKVFVFKNVDASK